MILHILSSNMHKEALNLPFELPESFLADNQVVAVLTGGTESQFVQLVNEGLIDLRKPVYLMVSGQSNSLAASLEILSYIRQHQGVGKVMRNAKDTLISELTQDTLITDSERTRNGLILDFTASLTLPKAHEPLRLGVVGKPSDWLIASNVNYEQVFQTLNIELVDIPIEEISSLGEVDPGMTGAEAIYMRLKEIVSQYKLQGVTLRCFDLLTTVKNTGCIALSKLNDEGIPAACEGDIPTLLTMMLCKRLTGELCFQVNPARIQENGEILFAHCTLPLGMTEKHEYTTHFESGIGVAIHGDLPTGDYTLVKLSGDLKRLLAVDVELERCQFEQNLCRTQVWIKTTPEVAQYFLTDPIANHHVLIRGHHANQFKKI